MYLILVVVSLMFVIYICYMCKILCMYVDSYNNKYMFFGFVDEFVY